MILRQVAEVNLSILTVLFKINIELINITNATLCCPVMFVLVAVPVTFVIAQIIACCTLALGSLLCELAFAISLFKVLLVTHFSLIFSLEPRKLGTCVLLVAASLAFLPSAGLCVYQTFKGQSLSHGLSLLTTSTGYHEGAPYLSLYLTFWTLVAISMMIFALVYIPYYLKQQHNSNAIQIAEAGRVRKPVSIKRIMLGFLGFTAVVVWGLIISIDGQDNRNAKLLPVYTGTLSLNLMLSYFVTEKEVLLFIKEKLIARLSFYSIIMRGASVDPAVDDRRV
jgi:hypothetical protein